MRAEIGPGSPFYGPILGDGLRQTLSIGTNIEEFRKFMWLYNTRAIIENEPLEVLWVTAEDILFGPTRDLTGEDRCLVSMMLFIQCAGSNVMYPQLSMHSPSVIDTTVTI